MFFDLHVHTEGLGLSDLKRMRESGVSGICSLYFYPIKPLFPQTMIDGFRRLEEFESFRCSILGIEIFPAVGIHPRCIPLDYKTVLEHLEANDWLAFGEIGLEIASDVEREVFRRQLEIAIEKDTACVIHTPSKNKREITEKTLEILRKLDFPGDLAVIDHVNFENLDLIEKSDFWIGLTVQLGKLSSEEAVRIVEKIGGDRCIVDSDAGFGDSVVTTVAETAKILGSEAKKVCFGNAKKFLGV
ncbi:MAG: TatD family hydrolase [Archaeoglobaceae archaeon]|nr:TatD family hydrolase [Archaeoglobaceae archaeon]MDW8118814.1 TatD family hydrolase [Archaeoglobaceae archaeon]